ncbi:MAG: DUF4157 domain-containing protein [Deltaproteobacteria bacterium]|nr:DUF4157 domain-containing protein [Deltaproteobacteria bacterium]
MGHDRGQRFEADGYRRDVSRDDDEAGAPEPRAPGRRALTDGMTRATAPRLDAELLQRASASAGAPLPAAQRRKFEGSLGVDLGSVRVHRGRDSEVAAASVAARAYTLGQDIHFGQGQYDPDSAEGEALLAHEVAHTAQQASDGVAASTPAYQLEVSAPGDAQELEADRAGQAMVAGAPAQVTRGQGLTRRVLRAPPEGGAAAPAPAPADDSTTPGWVGKSLAFDVLGKPFKLSFEDGARAELETGKVGYPSNDGFEYKKTYSVNVLGPLGFTASASVKGGIFASLSGFLQSKQFEVSPGKKALSLSAGGAGKLSFEAAGSLSAGAFLGAPFANLALEGYLQLAAEASSSVSLSGGGVVTPDGAVSGSIGMNIDLGATVKASGGVKLSYTALIFSGDIATWELASFDLATATIGIPILIDLATGQGIEQPISTKFEFMDFPMPSPSYRPLTDAERERLAEIKPEYRQYFLSDLRNMDGASGASAGLPPEAFEGGPAPPAATEEAVAGPGIDTSSSAAGPGATTPAAAEPPACEPLQQSSENPLLDAGMSIP